jgi:hypothetical protein
MEWDAALAEIRRTLKDDGVFMLLDVFECRFNALDVRWYVAAWAAGHFHSSVNREYNEKLSLLHGLSAWREMVRTHPKRKLSGAKICVQKKFRIERQKLLSQAVHGKTVGMVCGKLP